MKWSVWLAGVATIGLVAPAAAQQCGPDLTSFGWTMPQNLPITDQDAQRWPVDATLRVAYGGVWCPSADTVRLEKFDNNNPELPGTPIPAQIRFSSPAALVENISQPLTVVEVDPIDDLEPREDYRVVLSPPNPSLAVYENYTVEFRTRVTGGEPFPDFEGILGVETDGDRCAEPLFFEPLNDANPACLISSRMRLNVTYQPLDRGDIAYAIYRTSSTPLDENGDEVLAESDRTLLQLKIEAGARDTLGTGITPRRTRVFVLYTPLPRRDCFAVRALDEWGRERGDLMAEACIDLLPLAPCPDGCEGNQCMIQFPPPNPFETNEPILGQSCDNIGLNGAPADRPVPPIMEGGGGEGGGGATDAGVSADGGDTDGGAGGAGGDGEDSGDGGGCAQSDAPAGALFGLLLLGLARRRR